MAALESEGHFYLFFGCGSERSRCKWPDVVLFAPFLIMFIKVQHPQLRILLFNEAGPDKGSG
jgi:hypothetical protein